MMFTRLCSIVPRENNWPDEIIEYWADLQIDFDQHEEIVVAKYMLGLCPDLPAHTQ